LDNNRVYDNELLIIDWRPIGSDVRPTTGRDLLSLLTFTLKHGLDYAVFVLWDGHTAYERP